MIFLAKIMKHTTNFMIWTKNIDNIVKQNKNLIIIFGHPKCKPCQKIMFKIPIIFFSALINKYTLKFCNVLENKAKAKEIWIIHTPSLIVYKNGTLFKKIIDEKEINLFLKNFN